MMLPIPLHPDLIELECVNSEKFIVRRDSILHVEREQKGTYVFLIPRLFAYITFVDRPPMICWTTDELHKVRHTFRLDRWLREQETLAVEKLKREAAEIDASLVGGRPTTGEE